jgi:hypothetical protein
MDNCTPVSTPIDISSLLENRLDSTCPSDQRIEYQRIVGVLMYVALGTSEDEYVPGKTLDRNI